MGIRDRWAATAACPSNVEYRAAGHGASTGGMHLGHRRRTWHGAALALVVCAVAGAGVAWASAAASPRLLSDADNGHTVTVSVGTTLRLVLRSTYWRMGGSSAPSVVAVSGSPRYASPSGRHCRTRQRDRHRDVQGASPGTGKAVRIALRVRRGAALHTVLGIVFRRGRGERTTTPLARHVMSPTWLASVPAGLTPTDRTGLP